MSVKEELNSGNRIPSQWTRSTVADGSWLQKYTLTPLSARDDFLADQIDGSNSSISSVSAKLVELSGKTLTLSGELESTSSFLSGAVNYVSGELVFSAGYLNTKIENEISARRKDVDYLSGAIKTEIGRATSAETDLQNQIDLINASTDVINVYGSWSDFTTNSGQLFDTSAITDKDIIKVINDPNDYPPDLTAGGSHQTYHRWNITAENPHSARPLDPSEGEWNYIGYTDPYYNVAEIDEIVTTLSGTISNTYLSANGTAVQSGHNIVITKPDGDDVPHILIETSSHVTFTGVSATTLSASTAYGQSAKFDNVSATYLTALSAQGNSAKFVNFSGSYITGVNGNTNVTATISGLINSAENGGSMTGLKNASGIMIYTDPDKILPFTTSADLINLYVSGGASEWIGFDIDRTNNAITVTGNLLPILSAYLPKNWSGYVDSLFSGTSRSAQSAGSASQAFSAYSAYYSTSSNSAHNAENLGGQAPSYYLTTANLKSNAAGKISGYGNSAFVGGLTALQALNSTLTAEKIKLTSGTGIDVVPTGSDEIRISANPKLIGSAYSGYSAYNWITSKSATLSAGQGIGFVSAGPNILGITAAGRDIRSGRCIALDTYDDITFVDLSSTVSCENLYVSSNSALWQNGNSTLSARGGVVDLKINNGEHFLYFDAARVGFSEENYADWQNVISAGKGKFHILSEDSVFLSAYAGTTYTTTYTPSSIQLYRYGQPGITLDLNVSSISLEGPNGHQSSTVVSSTWYDLISGRSYVSATGNTPIIFSAVNTLPTTLEAGIYYLV